MTVPNRPTVRLVPASADAANALRAKVRAALAEGWALRQLFQETAARTVDPVPADWLNQLAPGFAFDYAENPGTPLHDPLAPAAATQGAAAPIDYPEALNEETAVQLTYAPQVEQVASFLRAGLSVGVYCDKILVAHLWRPMVQRAGLEARLLDVPDDPGGGGGMLGPAPYRQRQLQELKAALSHLKPRQVLVVPHLDLIVGDTQADLSPEARELTELVYGAAGTDRQVLAFADRSLVLPEVLANRFAIRYEVSGLPTAIARADGRVVPVGQALVTRTEAELFPGYVPADLFKAVAGMTPVRLRNAIRYAVEQKGGRAGVTVADLYDAIKTFKTSTLSRFEVTDVKFDDIGGYDEVKDVLRRAIRLLHGAEKALPPKLQRELIPRGFIFYGPPGTGKTLFAKAVAHELKATIQVVSGPEITDKYVGESERKLRELFAEARRNAPAVLVFDEFDALAGKRSGRDDGGSRAGNAVVAQILTEMDGFRPDVPMLVIGTTNRLDMIDDALLRPSRFQAVKITLPNPEARRRIAEVHAKHFLTDNGVPFDPATLDLVAELADGFNGDEIRSVFRDACVGFHCEGQEVTPRRLGYLVGGIMRARQQQSLERAPAARAAGARPGTGPRVSLLPTPPAAPGGPT